EDGIRAFHVTGVQTCALPIFDVVSQAERVRANIGVVNGGMGLYDRLTGREILHYFGRLYDMEPAAVDARIERLDQLLQLGDTLGIGRASCRERRKVRVRSCAL